MSQPDFRTAAQRERDFTRRADRYPHETVSTGWTGTGYAVLGFVVVWGAMWIAGWLA